MRIDRRTALLAPFAAGLATGAAGAAAQAPSPSSADAEIELWPGGPPGAPPSLPDEALRERSTDPGRNDRILVHVARPRLALFRPARPNGAAALIMPGGSYRRVVVDKEGYELARRLSGEGVTVFVLFYRLPGDGWAAGPDVALADAQRSIRMIRHRAGAFGLDPARVAAIGFSAGGHVCASLVARFADRGHDPADAIDRLSARPDAAALIYPVVAMWAPLAHPESRAQLIGADAAPERERAYSPLLHLRPDSPPCFLLHAEDDASVPVGNSLALREALRAQGVPVETHFFPDGGHGFGLRLARGTSVEHWPDLLSGWARYRGLWT